MPARRFLVTGRVQGVGFRYFVAREAQGLRLSGWVRNLTDGHVEVLANGDEASVGALEGRLWEGPPFARVVTVEASEDEPPRWSDFRILPTQW